MRLQDRFFSQVPAAYKPMYSMVVETAQKEHSIPLALAKKKRGTPVAPTSWGTFARVFMADSESRSGRPKPSYSRPPPDYYAKVMPFRA